MSDAIFITGLLVHARHGVMDHEQKVGQQFAIDLELTLDLEAAAGSDKLADTVSYSSIVDVTVQAFTARSFRLIEAAAGHVAEAVLAAFPRISAVKVRIHKPHAPIAAIFADVGVVVLRNRHG
jgi:7,8-dihydroneopterin aldolase/epimerase/oxygenase